MIMLDVYTMGGCKLFQLLICFNIVYPEVIEVNDGHDLGLTYDLHSLYFPLLCLIIPLVVFSWTLSFLEVVNVLQSLLLMSLHVVLPHLSLFRCTCSDCGSFCYHLRVGLSPVFECLLHHLWLPMVLVLSYSCDWLICQCFKLLVPNFMMSGYWCWLHYSHTSVSSAI